MRGNVEQFVVLQALPEHLFPRGQVADSLLGHQRRARVQQALEDSLGQVVGIGKGRGGRCGRHRKVARQRHG
ncbi:hypothetical protein LP419_09205 [Massilia sp. H-1]|nr:hypothetical protein LP419_09205 [Massilia sp. H-1]